MHIIDLLITSGMSSTITLIGVFISQYTNRKSSIENNIWNKREETYKNIRWACEQATDNNLNKNTIGLAMLSSLVNSELLQKEDLEIIENMLDTLQPKEDKDDE